MEKPVVTSGGIRELGVKPSWRMPRFAGNVQPQNVDPSQHRTEL